MQPFQDIVFIKDVGECCVGFTTAAVLADLDAPLLKNTMNLLPATLRTLALGVVTGYQLRLPAWDAKCSSIMDVALMLYRRNTDLATAITRYLFAPQVGRYVLIVKVRRIADDGVVARHFRSGCSAAC